MAVMSKWHRKLVITSGSLLLAVGVAWAEDRPGQTDNSPAWFYPPWAAEAPYNRPIRVRDTDSALGRYSVRTKELGLKDLARVHGHLCDGLVVAFVEIRAVMERLFPDGVVDRTDLRAVSRNGPCIVDAVTMMTGARINFRTLRVDNSIGEGFVIQRISTGEAYRVSLKPGIIAKEQIALEREIRLLRAQGKSIPANQIEQVEKLADALSRKVLTSEPAELVTITPMPHYQFVNLDLFTGRGDIINKSMPR